MPLPSDALERTIRYYEAEAEAYARDTDALDMAALYDAFLALLPARATILDAGCGPGRDAAHFLERGHAVVAFDASKAMVALAARRTGLAVAQCRLQEFDVVDRFDGVWASASLLHVPPAELPDALSRLVRALKPGGIGYLSFKWGDGERMIGDRYFTDQTEESLRRLIAGQPQLSVVRMWTSADQRPGRQEEAWVNGLVRKRTGTEG